MNYYAGFLNLDHRGDRLTNVTKELDRVGIQAVRHRGKLPSEFDLNNPHIQMMKNRTPGAIGCHMGQVQIMRTAQSLGKSAMVLEDDIVFCSDFQERMKIIDEFTTTHEWDIMWLGASFHVPAFWHPKGPSGMQPNCSANLGYDVQTTDNPRIVRTFGAYVTFAYIVNIKSIQKVIDYLDWFMHQTIGIDYSFIAAAKHRPDFKFFSFVPGCVMQIDNISDIGTGMTVWSGQLRNGPYVFQKLMTDFNPETFNFNA